MAKSPRKSKPNNNLLRILAVAFIVGGLFMGGKLILGVVEYFRMQSWEEVPAKIVRAELQFFSKQSKNDHHRAAAEYRYRYRGRDYTGKRIGVDDIGPYGPFGRDLVAELQESRRSGKAIPCYVDPEEPAEAVLFRGPPWQTFMKWAAGMLACLGIGIGLVIFQEPAGRRKRQEAMRAGDEPEQPWLWKEAWADGRIRASIKSLKSSFFLFALWSVFCLFLLMGYADSTTDQVVWWVVVLFLVVESFLLIPPVFAVLRWRKYGASVFQMAALPGVIGGQLAGVIRVPTKVKADLFRMKLSCMHRKVSKHGKKRRVRRSAIWQGEEMVKRDLLSQDPSRSGIPVLFQIPYECRESDDSDPDNMILWELEIRAETPGIDYFAEFEVPVFKTPQSDPDFVPDEQLAEEYVAPEDPERDLRDAGVIRTVSPEGDGLRFIFPMARLRGTAIGMTLFALLATGVSLFLGLHPGLRSIWIVFSIMMGPVGLILWIWVLELWFYRSVVDASPRGLRIRSGLFGYGRSWWIEASRVPEIRLKCNIKGEKEKNFDLLIQYQGKKIIIGKYLPGERVAKSVACQIEQAMGKSVSQD